MQITNNLQYSQNKLFTKKKKIFKRYKILCYFKMEEGRMNVKIECDAAQLDPLEKNILLERFEFYQRCQKSEETFYAFLEDIRHLAENCEFNGIEKELLIRDRFVCGLNDKSLQSSIITTGGNPTVGKVLELCQKYNSLDDNEIKVEELNVDDGNAESKLIDINDDSVNNTLVDCIDNSQSAATAVYNKTSKFHCKFYNRVIQYYFYYNYRL